MQLPAPPLKRYEIPFKRKPSIGAAVERAVTSIQAADLAGLFWRNGWQGGWQAGGFMTSEMERAIQQMVAKEVDRRLTYALVVITIIGAVAYWTR